MSQSGALCRDSDFVDMNSVPHLTLPPLPLVSFMCLSNPVRANSTSSIHLFPCPLPLSSLQYVFLSVLDTAGRDGKKEKGIVVMIEIRVENQCPLLK